VARALRHGPELWALKLDAQGWCDVGDLLSGGAKHGQLLSQPELEEIVETSDEKRFALSTNRARIGTTAIFGAIP